MIKISPVVRTSISIPAAQKIYLLPNKINKLVKDNHIPAVFSKDNFELNPQTDEQIFNIWNKLTEIGARFIANTKF